MCYFFLRYRFRPRLGTGIGKNTNDPIVLGHAALTFIWKFVDFFYVGVRFA